MRIIGLGFIVHDQAEPIREIYGYRRQRYQEGPRILACEECIEVSGERYGYYTEDQTHEIERAFNAKKYAECFVATLSIFFVLVYLCHGVVGPEHQAAQGAWYEHRGFEGGIPRELIYAHVAHYECEQSLKKSCYQPGGNGIFFYSYGGVAVGFRDEPIDEEHDGECRIDQDIPKDNGQTIEYQCQVVEFFFYWGRILQAADAFFIFIEVAVVSIACGV